MLLLPLQKWFNSFAIVAALLLWISDCPEGVVNVLQWANDVVNEAPSFPQAREIIGRISVICWAIWKSRNLPIFENKDNSSARVVEKAKEWLVEFLQLQNLSIAPSSVTESVNSGHLSGSHVVFCDAAFRSVSNVAAFGCALFDPTGKHCDSLDKSIQANSVLMAEAIAIKEVCRLAIVTNLSAQDDNSSILNQNFPPLKENSPAILNSHGNKSSRSINNSSLGGSEYAPSPLKTRAQRQKKGQPLPLTKQMKTVNRELKAYSRKSKSTVQPQTSNPDAFQWQIYEKDKKKREDEAAATIANDEQHQWKVCVYAKSPIVTAGASGTISSPLSAKNITIAHEEKAK
ncbi:hypothetical protein LguiA_021634 [Lonicera macranthoides]